MPKKRAYLMKVDGVFHSGMIGAGSIRDKKCRVVIATNIREAIDLIEDYFKHEENIRVEEVEDLGEAIEA